VTVTGKVIRSYNYQNKVLFLNFDPDYENTLSLVVFSGDFDKFGGVQKLQDRLMNK
jgi:bisphosphoglycerate-independent phosphoglycerate mutase (AlkP superfamily)